MTRLNQKRHLKGISHPRRSRGGAVARNFGKPKNGNGLDAVNAMRGEILMRQHRQLVVPDLELAINTLQWHDHWATEKQLFKFIRAARIVNTAGAEKVRLC